MSVWNRAETYEVGLGSPAAWLVRIARNRAIDRLRANTVRARAVESVPLESEPSENPEVNALLGEQRRVVARALNAIPREQRDLIEQAYFLHADANTDHGELWTDEGCRVLLVAPPEDYLPDPSR